ncbi:hypothetical protein E4T66_03310 [Sinimarinibacterium sp. CAU 1509]|uniref:hypothetical protein n=1 Tax=Sinimarinibacterium sp. CAU 1509 TaxID=2562283 RepID=UPI0010AB880C|nr:hypothetical protein [Sinimarinibacterium sp. CAU 1509]TJY65262.1 hypothetical protein E4T66_03310 [Sinimarinibacterium sp. CAU 1509]
MASIELSTEDAALIVLALASDRFGAAAQLDVGILREHWRNLGLRADDLIQGIAALARDGRATAHSRDQNPFIALSADCADSLCPDQGVSGLPQRLRDMLSVAAERGTQPSENQSGERRDGFR